MFKAYYIYRSLKLFYRTQTNLLEIIEITGLDAEMAPGVTIVEFTADMDVFYPELLKKQNSLGALKQEYGNLKAYNSYLNKWKRSLTDRGYILLEEIVVPLELVELVEKVYRVS